MDKKIIPESQKKNTFVISYALGGIGIGEITILLLSLIISILLIIAFNFFTGLILSIFVIGFGVFLSTTDKNTSLKGWQKIIRWVEFLQSKKRFTKKEVKRLLSPYKFDDENKQISIGSSSVSLLKVEGKDITKMTHLERQEFLDEFSSIIKNTNLTLQFYRDIVEPNKNSEIEYYNNLIIEELKKGNETKKSLIQSFAIEEIMKKYIKKVTYYICLVGRKKDIFEEKVALIDDLKTISINSYEAEYEVTKKFLKKAYNPFIDEPKEENKNKTKSKNKKTSNDSNDKKDIKEPTSNTKESKKDNSSTNKNTKKETTKEIRIRLIKEEDSKEDESKDLKKQKSTSFFSNLKFPKTKKQSNNIEETNIDKPNTKDIQEETTKNKEDKTPIKETNIDNSKSKEQKSSKQDNKETTSKEENKVIDNDSKKNNDFEKMKISKNHIKIGKKYIKYISIDKYPFYVYDGWAYGFTSFENVIPAFKIFDLNQDRTIKNLELCIQRNDIKIDQSKRSVKTIKELHTVNDMYKKMIENIVDGSEKIKDFLSLFAITGKSLSEIRSTEKKFKKEIRKDGFTLKQLPYIQFSAFSSFLPKEKCELKNELAVEMPTSTTGSFFPILNDDFIDENGMYLSNTSKGGEIYWNNEIRDDLRFNSNTIILGSSGSGKSVSTYKFVVNDYIKDNVIYIIDPEQEYIKLAEKLGGKVINMGGLNPLKINPLQILKSYDESEEVSFINDHISFLSAFLESTNKEIDQDVSILIKRELFEFYKKLKITNEQIKNSYEKIKWPIFDDLLKWINIKIPKSSGRIKDLLEMSSLIISQYATGGPYSNLWNHQQKFSFDDKLIVFDTSSLINDKYKISGQMLFITKIIWNGIQKNKKMGLKRYSSIYIDEAHLLMNKNNLFALEWIQMVTKRIRKYNGKLYLITQNVKDFLGDAEISHYTEGILNNISYSFIGKMQPKDLESLDQMYSSIGGLTTIEKEYIASAGRGKFLLKIGDKMKYYIEKIHINPSEARIFAPQILHGFEKEYIELFDQIGDNLY